MRPSALWRPSFPFTAAGQSRILTGFPFNPTGRRAPDGTESVCLFNFVTPRCQPGGALTVRAGPRPRPGAPRRPRPRRPREEAGRRCRSCNRRAQASRTSARCCRSVRRPSNDAGRLRRTTTRWACTRRSGPRPRRTAPRTRTWRRPRTRYWPALQTLRDRSRALHLPGGAHRSVASPSRVALAERRRSRRSARSSTPLWFGVTHLQGSCRCTGTGPPCTARRLSLVLRRVESAAFSAGAHGGVARQPRVARPADCPTRRTGTGPPGSSEPLQVPEVALDAPRSRRRSAE